MLFIALLLFALIHLADGRFASAESSFTGAEKLWVTRRVEAPGVQYGTFFSRDAHHPVSYHIYVPDAYNVRPGKRFPVLYWLHGSGGNLNALPTLAAYFDEAIRSGKIPPILVVFPNGMAESMWCDSKDGSVPMESVLVKELVQYIDSRYRTFASREKRMIEGFSMGGYGAARLGFKYSELFGAVSMLGAGPLQPEMKSGVGPQKKRSSSRDGHAECVWRRPGVLQSPEPVAACGTTRGVAERQNTHPPGGRRA